MEANFDGHPTSGWSMQDHLNAAAVRADFKNRFRVLLFLQAPYLITGQSQQTDLQAAEILARVVRLVDDI